MTPRLGLGLALLAIGCASSPPATGTTTIYTLPDGARVYVDGSYRGDTPLTLELEKRSHRVRLEKDGFDPTTSHISTRTSDNPGTFWFIDRLTLIGKYDAKYQFEESYSYQLAPASPETQ